LGQQKGAQQLLGVLPEAQDTRRSSLNVFCLAQEGQRLLLGLMSSRPNGERGSLGVFLRLQRSQRGSLGGFLDTANQPARLLPGGARIALESSLLTRLPEVLRPGQAAKNEKSTPLWNGVERPWINDSMRNCE
jgi:hypothetical protein